MVNANVIHRVFGIACGEATGTGFVIDGGDEQYLVTATHLIRDFEQAGLRVRKGSGWRTLEAGLIGRHPSADVAVLKVAEILTSPDLPMEASAGHLTYGQEVYFLGFPYGLLGNVVFTNHEYPLPFVKKATVSLFNGPIFFLDGHNNAGFSGGPVVFRPLGKPDFQVAAVVSGYQTAEAPVFDGESETPLVYRYNTGIIVAYNINAALEIIGS